MASTCDRVEDFLSGGSSKAELLKRLVALEKGSLALPGFNHPLYPRGDARAHCLLKLIRESVHMTKEFEAIYGFLDEPAAPPASIPSVARQGG
jgi:citrate synthase